MISIQNVLFVISLIMSNQHPLAMRSLTVTLLYCMPYGIAELVGENVGNSEGLVVGTGVGIVVGTGVGLVAADNGKNRSDMSHIRQRSIILDRVANQFKK